MKKKKLLFDALRCINLTLITAFMITFLPSASKAQPTLNCKPETCNLVCFGDFEDFTVSNDGYFSQLGLSVFEFDGEVNTPDILQTTSGDNYAYFFRCNYGPFTPCNIEALAVPLDLPIPPGCEVNVSFEAGALLKSGIVSPTLNFYATNAYPCATPSLPSSCPVNGINYCSNGDLAYCMEYEYPISITTPDALNLYSFTYTNLTPDPISHILIWGADVPNNTFVEYYLDDLIVTSNCTDQITVTPAINELPCTDGSFNIEYEVCYTNGLNNSVDVDLNAILPGILGIDFGTGGDFINGATSIPNISLGSCETVNLVIDIASTVPVGTLVDIGVETIISNACLSNPNNQTITFEVEGAPSSDFTFSIDDCTGTVTFTSSDQRIVNNHLWDFGDGTNDPSINEINPVHTYLAPGTYTVIHSILNDCGQSSTTQTIIINALPPVDASFTLNEVACGIYDFTSNNQASGLTHTWAFGDGANSSEVNPQHVYQNDGIYTITHTVSNPCDSETSTQTIDIEVTSPNATITTSQQECSTKVNFFTMNPVNVTHQWDFDGDINTIESTEANPCHDFQSFGNFNVTLIVSNTCGADTLGITITLDECPPPACSCTNVLNVVGPGTLLSQTNLPLSGLNLGGGCMTLMDT